MDPMFTATFFTIAKTWKKPKCSSTDEWIKNILYIYVCIYLLYIIEFYSVIKKNEILPFIATCMGLEIIILSKVSDRLRQILTLILKLLGMFSGTSVLMINPSDIVIHEMNPLKL